MRKKFWVDWSDTSFPEIKIHNFGDYKYGPTPVNFTDAKRDIIDHCESKIEHWREILRQVRALRAADVTADDLGEYR